MTGPSGVDTPAPDAPSMFSDPFRAFAAASQGDWERATTLMTTMSEQEWRSLVEVVNGMHGVLTPVSRTRRENALAARTDPAAAPPQ